MRLYVDVWAEEVLSKEDFWQVVEEATKAVSAVRGDGWKIKEVGLQTNRAYHVNISEQS